ncbi:MAG: alanine racemase [Akkermansiaceae bacterium]|nr:alanine racemase [Akkermansiaceae bacterium]
MSTPPVSEPRAWAEINLDALRRNLALAKEWSGSELMAVVKAGAYGHGMEAMAEVIAEAGVAYLGVAHVGEARRIRNAGIETPIYLLGPTWEGEREEIVAQGWTACVSTLEEARDFERLAADAGMKLPVHIALDTGMGRGGFLPEDLIEAMPKLRKMQHLELEGLGSHLPSADEDEAFTKNQIDRFEQVIESLGGVKVFRWRHLLNSAGMMGYQSPSCNLARPGLMIYGVSPLPDRQGELSTVMSLKSRVTLIRTLPAGHGVSYGRQFITKRPTRVATVGIGYGDGYPRHLSGQDAEVWLSGRRCPLLGRVTMDQIMIDVTDLEGVKVGDEVELFGPNIPVVEVAQKAGTIAWEIFTGITPRVTRVYQPSSSPSS